MSFSDTKLGGSESCSTIPEEDSSENASLSARASSEDAPCLEAEGCSSATAVNSSTHCSSLTSQTSQSFDSSTHRSTEYKVSSTDSEDSLNSIPDIENHAEVLSSPHSVINNLQHTFQDPESCSTLTSEQALKPQQAWTASSQDPGLTELQLADELTHSSPAAGFSSVGQSPEVQADTGLLMGPDCDSVDPQSHSSPFPVWLPGTSDFWDGILPQQVDSFSDTSKAARSVIEKDFGGGTFLYRVPSGTSNHSASSSDKSDPAFFLPIENRIDGKNVEEGICSGSDLVVSDISVDIPNPSADLVQASSGTNVDQGEFLNTDVSERSQSLPNNSILDSDMETHCGSPEVFDPANEPEQQMGVVSQDNKVESESSETKSDKINSNILPHSSAELAEILPSNSKSLPLESVPVYTASKEGRKISFSKMMDSAQSFRPLADGVNEADYTGQRTTEAHLLENHSPLETCSPLESQRFFSAACSICTESGFTTPPRPGAAVALLSSQDRSPDQNTEAQFHGRSSVLTATNIGNRFSSSLGEREEGLEARTPSRVHFSDHVIVGIFSPDSSCDNLETTEGILSGSPNQSSSDRLEERSGQVIQEECYPSEVSEEGLEQMGDLNNEERPMYSSPHSISKWLQSYLQETDSDGPFPFHMRRSCTTTHEGCSRQGTESSHTASLGVIVHRLGQLLNHNSEDRFLANKPTTTSTEAATSSTGNVSLSNISDMLQQLLQRNSSSSLTGTESPKQVGGSTNLSTVSLQTVSGLFEDLLKSLPQSAFEVESEDSLLSSPLTPSNYMQYAFDTSSAFQRYVLQQKSDILVPSTQSENANMQNRCLQKLEAECTADSSIDSSNPQGHSTHQKRNNKGGGKEQTIDSETKAKERQLANNECVEREDDQMLSHVVDILVQALRQKQPSEVTEVHLQNSSPSGMNCTENDWLDTVRDMLEKLLGKEEEEKQRAFDEKDTVFVVDLNHTSCIMPTCDENQRSLFHLFEQTMATKVSSGSGTNSQLYNALSEAFVMFKKYLIRKSAKTNKPCLIDSRESWDDRHDVEIFVHNSDENELSDEHESPENTEVSKFVEHVLKDSISAPIDSVSESSDVLLSLPKKPCRSSIQDQGGLRMPTKGHSGISGSKNASDQDTKPSLAKGSSQSLPCTSSVKIEIEKTGSAEVVSLGHDSQFVRDPHLYGRGSPKVSDLSTKDSLPGYSSPSDILKSKQLQKVHAVVSYRKPVALEKASPDGSDMSGMSRSIPLDDSISEGATQETDKPEAVGSLQLAEKAVSGTCSDATTIHYPSEEDDGQHHGSLVHATVSNQSNTSDLSAVSSIVDLVLHNMALMEKSSSYSVQLIDQAELENVEQNVSYSPVLKSSVSGETHTLAESVLKSSLSGEMRTLAEGVLKSSLCGEMHTSADGVLKCSLCGEMRTSAEGVLKSSLCGEMHTSADGVLKCSLCGEMRTSAEGVLKSSLCGETLTSADGVLKCSLCGEMRTSAEGVLKSSLCGEMHTSAEGVLKCNLCGEMRTSAGGVLKSSLCGETHTGAKGVLKSSLCGETHTGAKGVVKSSLCGEMHTGAKGVLKSSLCGETHTAAKGVLKRSLSGETHTSPEGEKPQAGLFVATQNSMGSVSSDQELKTLQEDSKEDKVETKNVLQMYANDSDAVSGSRHRQFEMNNETYIRGHTVDSGASLPSLSDREEKPNSEELCLNEIRKTGCVLENILLASNISSGAACSGTASECINNLPSSSLDFPSKRGKFSEEVPIHATISDLSAVSDSSILSGIVGSVLNNVPVLEQCSDSSIEVIQVYREVEDKPEVPVLQAENPSFVEGTNVVPGDRKVYVDNRTIMSLSPKNVDTSQSPTTSHDLDTEVTVSDVPHAKETQVIAQRWSLPGSQPCAPSVLGPRSYPVINVHTNIHTLVDKPSIHSVCATSLDSSLCQDSFTPDQQFSDSSGGSLLEFNLGQTIANEQKTRTVQRDFNSPTISSSGGLSFVGHLATSEVLQRDYDLEPNSRLSDGMIIPKATERKETFTQVQSDQTEYSLNTKYQLQVAKHPYSSSEPLTRAGLSPNSSTEVPWSFGSTDFDDGDVVSVTGDDIDEDPLDGWVDMVGGHGDDEVPEMDLLEGDVRFLFNNPLVAAQDSSSSDDSDYTPPMLRDEEHDEEFTSSSQWTTDNSAESLPRPETDLGRERSDNPLSGQTSGHENTRNLTPLESGSESQEEHVREIEQLTEYACASSTASSVQDQGASSSSTGTPHSSVDDNVLPAGPSTGVETPPHGSRSDQVPDGRSKESFIEESRSDEVPDGRSKESFIEESRFANAVSDHESIDENSPLDDDTSVGQVVDDGETCPVAVDNEQISMKDTGDSAAEHALSDHQSTGGVDRRKTPPFLYKRNPVSVQHNVSDDAFAELTNLCPDLRLDPLGCSSSSESKMSEESRSTFKMTRNPCYVASTDSLDADVLPSQKLEVFANNEKVEMNQLQCDAPSTSKPIPPPRSHKLSKCEKQKLAGSDPCDQDASTSSHNTLETTAASVVEAVLLRSVAEVNSSGVRKKTKCGCLQLFCTGCKHGSDYQLLPMLRESVKSKKVEHRVTPTNSHVENHTEQSNEPFLRYENISVVSGTADCKEGSVNIPAHISMDTLSQNVKISPVVQLPTADVSSLHTLSAEAEIPNSSLFITGDEKQLEEMSSRSAGTAHKTADADVWLQHVAEPAHPDVFHLSPLLPSVLESDLVKCHTDEVSKQTKLCQQSLEVKQQFPVAQTSCADEASLISRCYDARPHSQHVPLPTQRLTNLKPILKQKNANTRPNNNGTCLFGLPRQRPNRSTSLTYDSRSNKTIHVDAISQQFELHGDRSQQTPTSGEFVRSPVKCVFKNTPVRGMSWDKEHGETLTSGNDVEAIPQGTSVPVSDVTNVDLAPGSLNASASPQASHPQPVSYSVGHEMNAETESHQGHGNTSAQPTTGSVMMGTFNGEFGCGVYVCNKSASALEEFDLTRPQTLKVQVRNIMQDELGASGSREATELCVTISPGEASGKAPETSHIPVILVTPPSSTSLPNDPQEGSAGMDPSQKRRTVTMLSSNYKIASQDVRTYLVEKELLESRCRKLEMEVSILQTERQQLDEKNSRSEARSSDLESQLSEVTQQLEETKVKLSQEVAKTREEKQVAMETEVQAIKKLTNENGKLKAELSSVKKVLESQHGSDVSAEMTKSLSAYKAETAALKTQLAEVKDLLHQSEAHVQSLEEQKRSAEVSLVKLTKVKDFLHQSGGNGLGETSAEFINKSLEKRLKMTEESFCKERTARANSLSEVEEKLLTQNSKLVVAEMELTRQLQRAKDRCRHLDEKAKGLREQNMALRLALPLGADIPTSNRENSYDLPGSIHSAIRTESKLMTTDMKEIMTLVQRETGYSPGEEMDMVCELWRRYEAAGHKLQEWQEHLFDLKIRDGDITTGLQNLKEMKGQYEEKIRLAEEEVEDILNEKNALETTYKQQVSELVKERHEAAGRLKTLEELMAALRAENEALKEGMAAREDSLNEAITAYKAQVEELGSEKEELEVKLSQLRRKTKLQTGEIDTFEAELRARERALDDVARELEATKQHLSEEEQSAQWQIDAHQEQIRSLEEELLVWQDKYRSACEQKENMTAANQEALRLKEKVAEGDEKKKAVLEHELLQREDEVRKVTNRCQETEAELEQTKHSLLLETRRNADIDRHVKMLEEELKERQKFAESQNISENEQFKQFNSLKEALEGVTQELLKSKATLKRLETDLSYEKDKSARLEDALARPQLQPGEEAIRANVSPLYQSSAVSQASPAVTDLRLRDIQQEKDKLRGELSQSHGCVESQRGEISELKTQLSSVTQELTVERETACQLTADKSDLEQHLQCCVEERDELYAQKETCDRDLNKLEQCLHDVITKFDLESRQKHGNFQRSYDHLGPEAQKIGEECVALRLLLEGKDAELGVLSDKLGRQTQDLGFCRQKMDMLLKENLCHREDISNQTAQLALKMKEMAATMEINQLLMSERSQLQMEVRQAEAELEKEKEFHERRNQEVAEILKKIDISSESQKSTQHEMHKLDNKVVSLEADLRHANSSLAQLGAENQQSKAKVERLNEDIRSLTNINTALEQRLEREKTLASEGQSTVSSLKEDLKKLSEEMESLKHEKTLLMTSVESERKTAENLKTQLDGKEEEVRQLRLDMDSHRGQLLVSRENFEQLSKEKQNIYADYQELCRQLNEKEKSLVESQAMFNTSMENIHKDFSQEKASLETDKLAAVKEMDVLRDEIRELKEKLSQKEVQLCTFGRTLQELEEMTKQSQELEEKLQKMTSAADDSKILINSHRTENMTLRENLKNLEDKYSKLEEAHRNLEEELRNKRDDHSVQTLEFKQSIAEMKTGHEMEKFELKEKLAKAESQLETAQSSLSTLHDSHRETQAKSQSMENSLHQVRTELQQTATDKQILARKLAALQEEFDRTKRKSAEWSTQAKQAQARCSNAEQQLTADVEKFNKLKKEFTELQAAAYVHESNARAKQDQVDMLQGELNKMRQMLENQRQQLASKYKKASFDFKQQSDSLELEKRRLLSQTDQLASDLEQAREQISMKGRENLKLQEDLLNMEAQLRETASKLRQAQDSLRHEEELQQKANHRNTELEEELKRVKTFVTKKVQDDGSVEGKITWNEMNRFMQELNMKMDHLNIQKASNNDNRDSGGSQRLRKQLVELQTELHTEKALHQITRSSLQASEDDCQRLRRQLRSKQRTSSADDKSQKSRMEKINEIIAKSQTQAQMMMASGGYYDYSSRDVSLATPRSEGFSPDNSLADHSALFNTSYNNNNSATSPAGSSPEHKS